MRVKLVQRVTVLGIGAAVLVAFAVSQFMGATPEAGVPTIVPLETLAPEAVQTIRAAPFVSDPDITEREPGVVVIDVDAAFNSGLLRTIEPEVKLISDHHAGDIIIDGVYHPLISRSITVYVPDERIDAFIASARRLPGVINADKGGALEFLTDDPYWQTQQASGLSLVDLADYWNFFGRGSPNVRVAVVDSGVGSISELSGRLDAGHNSFDGGSGIDTDDTGHGTAVASILAAACDNGIDICGIAPGVRIVPVKVCQGTGLIPCPAEILNDGLQWLEGEAIAGRVQVINMSIGKGNELPSYVHDRLRELHDDLHVMMFAAAGNDGHNPVDDPARSPYVTAVGGSNLSGGRDPGSNYGADLDVIAPWETWAVRWGSLYQPDGGVAPFGMTSGATPIVAGLAALYKSGTLRELAFSARDAFITHQSWWNDQVGNGVPSDSNNYIQYFSYPWACKVWDLDGDHNVDVADEQRMAYRYSSFFGSPLYEVKYDVEPYYWQHDLDIDTSDLQRVFGRDGMSCP